MTLPPRRTITRSTSVEGKGLHTGAACHLVFHPGPAGSGIRFRRVDLAGRPFISARYRSVIATDRQTVLAAGPATLQTVEHVLAAATALQVDDLVIDVDGPEVPILDGSAQGFVDALAAAQPVEVAGHAAVLRVLQPFTITDGEAEYDVSPGDSLRVEVTIEWDHPLIGRQTGAYDIATDVFVTELAGARTFGFVRDVEALHARGLALGANPSNVVALTETDVLENTLRWPDEFVRHKAMDLVGDLALAGARVWAHIVARRPSHTGNIAVARALARRGQRMGHIAMDINDILNVIPHRYPMLLVDRILEVDGDQRIVGLKNVTINEPFFQGHFPGHPIMPGVLIVEAMAQVGGMLLMNRFENSEDKVVYFLSLDKVKFRKPVVPGDQLRLEVEMIQVRGATCRMRGVGYVDGKVVAQAEMMARVMDK